LYLSVFELDNLKLQEMLAVYIWIFNLFKVQDTQNAYYNLLNHTTGSIL